MSSSSSSPTIILCLLFIFLLNLHPSSSSSTPSAYEVLESFDFPVGLLPKGAASYKLNHSTGEFEVRLSHVGSSCKYHVDSYQLEYKPIITGVIAQDRLTNLQGIRVRVLFLWLNIVEVVRNADHLQFSVGIASAEFPLDGFDESPECGCGFDCLSLGRSSASGRAGLVSSS